MGIVLGSEAPLNTGWLQFASTASFSSDGNGTDAWTNPGFVLANDGSVASDLLINGTQTDGLLCQGLESFSIPESSVIVGVEVALVDLFCANGPTAFTQLQLVKGGVATGDNKTSGSIPTATGTTTVKGSFVDDWTAGLSPADVIKSDFGCVAAFSGTQFSSQFSIDQIKLRIHYK